MKQVVLKVTTTGGLSESAGTSPDVAGYAGRIVASILTGPSMGIDNRIDVYERIDGASRLLFTWLGLETGTYRTHVEQAHRNGLAVTDLYIDGIAVFGGQLYMDVSGSNDSLHKLRLLIDDK